MTWLIILVNLAVFIYELTLPAGRLESFFFMNGLVPAKLQALGSAPLTALGHRGANLKEYKILRKLHPKPAQRLFSKMYP